MDKKKKLIWHIFPSFLIITFLSLSAVTSYSTSYFRKIFLKNSEKELTIRAKLLQKSFADSLKVNLTQIQYIDEQCKVIGETTGTRVTVVRPTGIVIGDSLGNIKMMENHKNRPEIIQALKMKKGVSIRYSSTFDKNMMYIALPIIVKERVIAVVRTSVSISSVDSEIKSIRNNILVAMFFTILIAAAASLYVARRIARPIERMKKGAAKFARGDLSARLSAPNSEELSELAVTMNRMAQNLAEKIKDFKDRSMELEAVHSSMQEGVLAIDKRERIITINNTAARIFNSPASQLKAKYIYQIAKHYEFQNFIRRALETHEPIEDDIVITKDEDMIINIHSTALYDTGNTRMGTLIIFHDITRIRRLENMHKDFAANVSHELKTPLTTVKGFIETLQEMFANNDTSETENFLKIIEKNVDRMVELINDLLSLSKLERLEGTPIEFENQNLLSLIHGVVNTCHAAIRSKKIKVSIDCPDDLIARVDPGLMEQAIFNLVDNAVKYSRENTPIEISITRKGCFIDIVIKDKGCGIKKEYLQKIFNRFYRVDKARSRNEGGTGLGLAIVKHIVRYHNGKIGVISQIDKGSSFTITIPC